MTMPPDEDPFRQDSAHADPQRLPPGFYFPPGTGPQAAPPSRGGAAKWIAAVVAVLLAIAIAVGLYVMRADGDAVPSAWKAWHVLAVNETGARSGLERPGSV